LRLVPPVTVLFSNNYGTDTARAGWRAGRYPDHHLYGTNRLPEGYAVRDLPFRAGDILSRLSDRLPQLGELDQQWLAWRLGRRRPAVVLSANHTTVRALAVLRRARLLRLPVVGVVHGAPASAGRLSRLSLLGLDAVITPSEHTAAALRDLGVPAERITIAPWGPDVSFAPFEDAPPGEPVVSLGKSNRDPETLVRALLDVDVPARVYAHDLAALRALDPPARIELVEAVPARTTDPRAPLDYDHVLADLRRARIVAIPMRAMRPLHGLTELDDALACGKPVVMTRAPYIDLDIEGEGVGRLVDERDVEGWKRALAELLANGDELRAMGERGRRLVEARWNSELFAAGVATALAQALGTTAAKSGTPSVTG
jgi:glycosyltransferase involved in cell wall biosynthesis